MDWHSIHVYYYEDDKRDLVLDGVRPLFRRLPDHVAASYTRHWRRGPHLRLNFRTDAATFADVVRPAAEEVLGRFLAAHPSTRQLDPERFVARHRRLAELEYEEGPLLPWFPDNSLRVADFDLRAHVLGSVEAANLLADFYADATELAFRATETITHRAGLLAMAFDLLVATAHAMSDGGITRGFISFRSHAEGFLRGYPEGEGLRPAWDQHYARSSDQLAERMAAVLDALETGREHVSHVREWVAELTRHRDRAARLVESGVSSVPPPDTDAQARVGEISPFHRRLFGNPSWAAMQNDAGFVTYRLMLNFTYLHLTRLGVAPTERLLLCHLAANAVEDSHGVSAYELVGQPYGDLTENAR